jgi:two-component system phosphate regulon sensor histidine kinase PhoR
LTTSGKRSILLLLVILIVPVLIYGVYQLNSLTNDEEELTTIYRRQLESVLFSVNQTVQEKSDEAFQKVMMPNTANVNEDTVDMEGLFDQLSVYRFFRAFYTVEVKGIPQGLLAVDGKYFDERFSNLADSLISANQDVVNRLVRYMEQGNFQKVQAFSDFIRYGDEELDFQFFVSKVGNRLFLNVYFFNARSFIDQTLVPKLQELAQGDFVLICRPMGDENVVYSTSDDFSGDIMSEPLDLLPRFEVGIARLGGTIEDAVTKRRDQNLLALGILMLVLIIGVVLVFRNVQREMELAQKKADFVSNVSHEIRTPLALINMFAETLLLDRVKEEGKKKEYYEIITKEVGRLTNMLNRILSFSKIEANKKVLRRETLDLNDVVADVMNTYSYHLESNGFDHELHLSDEPLSIEADKDALTEVLVNLIDNGMKYSHDEKQIMVSTNVEQGFAVVAVKDQGIGIAKHQVSKLFEKFYRVTTGDVHDTKGAGLGLSIVKHIMEGHEGEIKIDSELGKGSTFKLYFPLKSNNHA